MFRLPNGLIDRFCGFQHESRYLKVKVAIQINGVSYTIVDGLDEFENTTSFEMIT